MTDWKSENFEDLYRGEQISVIAGYYYIYQKLIAQGNDELTAFELLASEISDPKLHMILFDYITEQAKEEDIWEETVIEGLIETYYQDKLVKEMSNLDEELFTEKELKLMAEREEDEDISLDPEMAMDRIKAYKTYNMSL